MLLPPLLRRPVAAALTSASSDGEDSAERERALVAFADVVAAAAAFVDFFLREEEGGEGDGELRIVGGEGERAAPPEARLTRRVVRELSILAMLCVYVCVCVCEKISSSEVKEARRRFSSFSNCICRRTAIALN